MVRFADFLPVRVVVAGATYGQLRAAFDRAGCVLCAEAPDAAAAIDAALRERPDVCLVDTALPGGGLSAVAAIAAELPDTSIVMLGHVPSHADLFAALAAGASGYLIKGIDPDRLAIALERIRAGEAALSRMLVSRLIQDVRRRRLPRLRSLTNREFEVLELLCQGMTTAEIAERFFVARATVRTHIAAILNKLGVPDRQSAIRVLASAEKSQRLR